MKNKKNIDKIFKDGFKNLEASPSPRVWENIQAELNKEKGTRKVIPLWIQIGGVAALIALMLSVGNWVYDSNEFSSPTITHENTNQTENELQERTRGNEQVDEIRIASEEKRVVRDSDASEEVIQTEESNIPKNGTDTFDKVKMDSPKKSVETRTASGKYKSDANEKSKDALIKTDNQQEGIAEVRNSSKAISTDRKENKISSEEIITNGNKEDRISSDINKNTAATEEVDIARVEEKQEPIMKPSLLDAITEQENLKDEKEKKEKVERRWQVTPNLAPVYYSGLGNGSSIDPEFADNPQKGDVNMSYGVQVSYALNDRLSVRTGLNNVDLSYSTSDIYIASGPVGMGLRGVDYGGRQNVVTAIDRATLENAPSNVFGSLNLKSTSGDARLIQNITYYEVPVELQYAVIDSRFGLNLIGGVSTLFLGNNEISVRADNFNSVLGSANNLSNVSFSTNVGLGLNYKLSKKFIFNVEPMFKYQLNPYSDSSVDFKPYYLGIYSGLSFKF